MKAKLILALVLTAVAFSSSSAFAAAGTVYTLTNSSSGNAVQLFSRSADGQISPEGRLSLAARVLGKDWAIRVRWPSMPPIAFCLL